MRKLFRFKRLRRGGRSRVGNAALFVVMIALSVLMIAPLVYSVINSFKPLDELFAYPPRFFVVRPTMENYSMLFKLVANMRVPFSRYLFNTLVITLTGTVGHILLASLCAYSLSKIPFPGSGAVFQIIVLSLMFSPVVTTVPTYIIMSKIGLVDTLWAVILPALQSSLGLYLIKQFLDTLPDTLLEAARIDGAGEMRLFLRIVMPNLKPAWLTLGILSIQSLWNIVSPYTYSEELKTLPQALSQIVSAGISRSGVGSAVALLMIVVPIFCFVIAQGNIIQTMSTSGMKD